MACPGNPPPPDGYRVWVGPVPPSLTDWASDLLYHQSKGKPYFTTWIAQYNGEDVIARLDHHPWTHRNGQLVWGCFAGITLYRNGTQPAVGEPAPTPDNVAMYTKDLPIDWGAVALSAGAGAAVVGLFWLFMKK